MEANRNKNHMYIERCTSMCIKKKNTLHAPEGLTQLLTQHTTSNTHRQSEAASINDFTKAFHRASK